jgi:hypothetical protein
MQAVGYSDDKRFGGAPTTGFQLWTRRRLPKLGSRRTESPWHVSVRDPSRVALTA